MPGDEPRQRLFFGLWPGERVRRALDYAARERLGKRVKRVRAGNLHITLAFVGAATAEQRRCLERAADAVRAPQFELAIDRLVYWEKPRILWAGPRRIPVQLRNLAATLQQGLAGCGFEPDARAYVPHMTLARKQHRAPGTDDFPMIAWSISEFCLIESVTDPAGVRYRVLRTWALGGG